MYSNPLDLRAIDGEREELVARYRREQAAWRTIAPNGHTHHRRLRAVHAFTAVLRPLRLIRRSRPAPEHGTVSASQSTTASR